MFMDSSFNDFAYESLGLCANGFKTRTQDTLVLYYGLKTFYLACWFPYNSLR